MNRIVKESLLTCIKRRNVHSQDLVATGHGLEIQSFSYHPALLLIAAQKTGPGLVLFLCLPYFSRSELRGGVDLGPCAAFPSAGPSLDPNYPFS
eukprot:1072329-Pelagomonas_calceolata.AAC.3